MEQAKKYSERMFRAYQPLRQYLEEQRAILPVLEDSIEHQIATSAQEQELLNSLRRNIERLTEVHQRMRDRISQAGVAVGKMQEQAEVANSIQKEYAHLTTLSQHTLVAAQVSEQFHKEALEAVIDVETWGKAYRKVNPKRQREIKEIVNG